MKSLSKSNWLLFFGILAVSTASLFIRKAQQYLPSTLIAAGRLVIATLVLAPVCGKTAWNEIAKVNRQQRLHLCGAGIFLGIHFLVWIKSLELTSVASSVVLVTSTPIWVALFSPILLKEKVTKNNILGLLVAMLGILVLFFKQNTSTVGKFALEDLFGNLLALVGAWMAAGYTMVGRSVRDQISLPSYVFWVYGIAAITGMLAAIPALSNYNQGWLLGLPWLILLALIPQLIGHTLFNAALRRMNAVYASIALLGEPVGSTILAWIFLNESPSTFDIMGGICVLVGILLTFLFKNENHQNDHRVD